MKIYELLIGFSTSIEGLIWCTDGSFVEPELYQSSGKVAYGYALNNSTVARITRSDGMEWSFKDSYWYNANFLGAQSETDGVSNSRYLSLQDRFDLDNCPAVYFSCTDTNAGKTSYMPAIDEVRDLYKSIMNGAMKEDLIAAGLYTSCNYRDESNDFDIGWTFIWSSSQYLEYYNDIVWGLDYEGEKTYSGKCDNTNCVIPFFKLG